MTESTLLASRPPSVASMLLNQVKASGPREALRHLEGDRWVSLTWTEVQQRVFELAAGLLGHDTQHVLRQLSVPGSTHGSDPASCSTPVRSIEIARANLDFTASSDRSSARATST